MKQETCGHKTFEFVEFIVDLNLMGILIVNPSLQMFTVSLKLKVNISILESKQFIEYIRAKCW